MNSLRVNSPLKNCYVIDNFLPDPDSVRTHIINFTKENKYIGQGAHSNPDHDFSAQYHGRRWKEVDNSLAQYIEDTVSNVLEQKVVMGGYNSLSKYIHYNLITEYEGVLQRIHLDKWWTGILYLSDGPIDCGTILYKKNEDVHVEPHLLKLDSKGHSSLIFSCPDHDFWSMVYESEYRYNSMFLFKADEYYHVGNHGFGNTNDNCRITIPCFFEPHK